MSHTGVLNGVHPGATSDASGRVSQLPQPSLAPSWSLILKTGVLGLSHTYTHRFLMDTHSLGMQLLCDLWENALSFSLAVHRKLLPPQLHPLEVPCLAQHPWADGLGTHGAGAHLTFLSPEQPATHESPDFCSRPGGPSC